MPKNLLAFRVGQPVTGEGQATLFGAYSSKRQTWVGTTDATAYWTFYSTRYQTYTNPGGQLDSAGTDTASDNT